MDEIAQQIARRIYIANSRGTGAKFTPEMVKYIMEVPGGLASLGLEKAEQIRSEKNKNYLKSEALRKRQWRKDLGLKTGLQVTNVLARKIFESRQAGMTFKAIAEKFHVSISTAEYYGNPAVKLRRQEYEKRRYEKRKADPDFHRKAREAERARYHREKAERANFYKEKAPNVG